MSEICITHEVAGFPQCTVRDEHLSSCGDDSCGGCLPRRARFGMLCPRCFGRVERALRLHWEFLRMLSGVRNAVTRDGGSHSRPGPGVPLSGIQLDRDELWSMLESLPRAGDAQSWVSTFNGALDALRFAKRMQQVAATHPWQESEHPVQIARCPKCARRTLRWRPPAVEFAPVTVACADPRCGYSMLQDRFELLADIEERARRQRRAAVALGPVEQWCVDFRADPERGRGEWPTVVEVEAAFGLDVWLDEGRGEGHGMVEVQAQAAPMVPVVTVYTKSNCAQCDATKRWLTQRGIEFETADVTEPSNLAAAVALGHKQAPVVVVAVDGPGSEITWSGFRPDMLSALAEGRLERNAA